MSYVGLDPQAASELARHLDEAARDLESHASTVAGLLDQAGIVSSAAPAQLREIAGWAAYRSRDLRRRIDKAVAADSGGVGAIWVRTISNGRGKVRVSARHSSLGEKIVEIDVGAARRM